MRNSLPVVVLLVAFLAVASFAGTSTPVYNPANGHYYALLTGADHVPAGFTWTQANDSVRELSMVVNGRTFQAHLVTITSADENDFLSNTIAVTEWNQFWIGASKVYASGVVGTVPWSWGWVTGEQSGYSNWQQWGPETFDGQNPLEPYGRMLVWSPWFGWAWHGTWQDWPDVMNPAGHLFSIVEFEPKLLAPTHAVALRREVVVNAPILAAASGSPMSQVVDWGDGIRTTCLANPENTGSEYATLSASHTYQTPGVYSITMWAQVVENGGKVVFSQASTSDPVVVYGHSGAFVAGGGWFTSPPGAFAADPSLTGKATFAFVSKHWKEGEAPTGQITFQLLSARASFRSTTCDWLLVAGRSAECEGVGAFNGVDGYGFMVKVIDGQFDSKGGDDCLRIRIWRLSDGSIVYDNQADARQGSLPSAVIGGGNIQIHSSK